MVSLSTSRHPDMPGAPHVVVSVFAGPDPDHRANCGAVVFRRGEDEEFILRVEDQYQEARARVEALIEASSLGAPEAKAARESVPPEVGIAIARAADYLGRAERAEARLDAVRKALTAIVAEPYDQLEVEEIAGEVAQVQIVRADAIRRLLDDQEEPG